MKKIIAIVAFFAITLLSTDVVVAQELSTRNLAANAKTFTHELVQEYGIDGDQQRAIYNAHMLKERKTIAVKKNVTDKAVTKAKLGEINTIFNEKLASILTPAQYKKYMHKMKK